VLGVPFLENYYSIYDYDQQRIGLALHIYSDAAIRPTFSWWAILLIALGVIVVFPLIVFGFYCIYKVRRNKRRGANGSQIGSFGTGEGAIDDGKPPQVLASELLLQKDLEAAAAKNEEAKDE
jgi:hypothetical protein